jgi:acetylglutamate kinase
VRKNLFIKVSGDVCDTESFIDYLKEITTKFFTVICVGGGTQINEVFAKIGVEACSHGPMGREHSSFELRQVARNTLEKNQCRLQDKLAGLGINAVVVIPVIDVGSVLCHVNGDQMVRTVYIGFDKLVVITTPERMDKKASEFSGLTKVEVVGLS